MQEMLRKNEVIQQSESRHRVEIDSLTNQIQACQSTITTLTQQQQTREFTRNEAMVQVTQQVCVLGYFPSYCNKN